MSSDSLIVFGSSRKDGNTRRFTDWIASEIECEIIDLALLNLSPYDYEHKNINDDFLSIIDKILQAKNLIISSPVYWYSVSAQMKVFIDRLSDLLDVEELKDTGRKLKGKNVYAVCTSISSKVAPSFENTVKHTFEYLGMSYEGCLHANCENGYSPKNYEKDVEDFLAMVRKGAQ